jgi:hypothetical protein
MESGYFRPGAAGLMPVKASLGARDLMPRNIRGVALPILE